MKYRHFIKTAFLHSTGIEPHVQEGRLFDCFVFRDNALWVEIDPDLCCSDILCLKMKRREIMLDIAGNTTGVLIEPLLQSRYGAGDPWPMQQQMKRLLSDIMPRRKLQELRVQELHLLHQFVRESRMQGFPTMNTRDMLYEVQDAIMDLT